MRVTKTAGQREGAGDDAQRECSVRRDWTRFIDRPAIASAIAPYDEMRAVTAG